MAQPNLERLFLRLSERLQDVRGSVSEADTGHDFTKLQLVQAINNAVKSFINKVVKEETLSKVAIILERYVEPEVTLNYSSGGYPLNDTYLKVIAVRGNNPQVSFDHCKPENWEAIQTSYNEEENSGTPRWTQVNDKVYAINNALTDIIVTVIKKHNDIALGDTNDILLDDRYDEVILPLAQADIATYSPIT